MANPTASSVGSSTAGSPSAEARSRTSAMSSVSSVDDSNSRASNTSMSVRGTALDKVFSVNVLAKILQVAERGLRIEVGKL
jgi:hypothetical protein